MQLSAELIGSQPILALFLAIGLGYAVGQINILGFSLGVGAVLFVGLAIGALAPKAQIAGPIGLIGLMMFLYGIGTLYGRQFFEVCRAPGRIYNLLAFVAIVAGLLVALGLGRVFHMRLGHVLGIFAGSMTSTPTLQAALDALGNNSPSIGYSVAYPFGVIGPILCFYFLTRAREAGLSAAACTLPHGRDHHRAAAARRHGTGRAHEDPARGRAGVERPPAAPQPSAGRRYRARTRRWPADCRRPPRRRSPKRREILGRLDPDRLAKDRSDLSYQRFFVSKAGLTGVPLAELPMPAGFPMHILHLRRYDVDIVPTPDATLEIGDRVGVLVPPENIAAARAFIRRLRSSPRRNSATFRWGSAWCSACCWASCRFRCPASER